MGINLCKIDEYSIPNYEVFKEGWLYKKSSLLSNHSRKWVVLSRNPHSSLLCFKDHKKTPQECSIYFSLKDVEFKVLDDMGFQFKKKKGVKNSWSFYCNDEIEYQRWIISFNSLIEQNERSISNAFSSKWTLDIIADGDLN